MGLRGEGGSDCRPGLDRVPRDRRMSFRLVESTASTIQGRINRGEMSDSEGCEVCRVVRSVELPAESVIRAHAVVERHGLRLFGSYLRSPFPSLLAGAARGASGLAAARSGAARGASCLCCGAARSGTGRLATAGVLADATCRGCCCVALCSACGARAVAACLSWGLAAAAV